MTSLVPAPSGVTRRKVNAKLANYSNPTSKYVMKHRGLKYRKISGEYIRKHGAISDKTMRVGRRDCRFRLIFDGGRGGCFYLCNMIAGKPL